MQRLKRNRGVAARHTDVCAGPGRPGEQESGQIGSLETPVAPLTSCSECHPADAEIALAPAPSAGCQSCGAAATAVQRSRVTQPQQSAAAVVEDSTALEKNKSQHLVNVIPQKRNRLLGGGANAAVGACWNDHG